VRCQEVRCGCLEKLLISGQREHHSPRQARDKKHLHVKPNGAAMSESPATHLQNKEEWTI
jgi:hypothetical protein